MNGEPVLKNDPGLLVDTIRESILEKINLINTDCELEIKKIDDEVKSEIEKFRSAEKKKHDELIAYEEGKAANLFSIELKKQKLEVVEDFINRIMSGAAAMLRTESRYPDFIKWCAASPLVNVSGSGVTVHLSSADMEFAEMVREEIRKIRSDVQVTIAEDKDIITGGAMVVDEESEVVFNNTVDRIIYRNIEEIKRVIVRALDEFINGANKA